MNNFNLRKFLGGLSLHDFTVVSTLGFVFFSTVPFGIAAKHIFSGLMLVGFVVLLFKGRLRHPPINGVTMGLLLLVSVALISCLVSPYRWDSLNNFRKDTLPFLLAFLVMTSQRVSKDQQHLDANKLVWAIVIGFSCRSVLAFLDGVADGWNFSVYESGQLPKYLEFFAADTIYYMPILLTLTFFGKRSRIANLALLAITVLDLWIVLVSGVRTSFALTILTLIIVLLAKYWYSKRVLVAIMALVCVSLAIFISGGENNPTISRYFSLLSKNTYATHQDGSVSARKAIAKAVLEINSERMLLGYGQGWKKLPTVAHDRGFMNRWTNSLDPMDKIAHEYFVFGEGRVNPHNFYLSVMFETGALGLLAYLCLMFAVFFYAVQLARDRHYREDVRATGLAALVYVVIYLVAGISGGPWLPAPLLAFGVFMAIYKGNVWGRHS